VTKQVELSPVVPTRVFSADFKVEAQAECSVEGRVAAQGAASVENRRGNAKLVAYLYLADKSPA
jgi:hypothetical protein